jgi:hypothetical protein
MPGGDSRCEYPGEDKLIEAQLNTPSSSNQTSKIVATSPVVHEPGMLPHRTVIRDLSDHRSEPLARLFVSSAMRPRLKACPPLPAARTRHSRRA